MSDTGVTGHGGAALHLAGAAFGYGGVTRVEDLDLVVPEGAAVALIGPNGSGKSTLLRGILGLADLTAGSVRVLGETPEAARRSVGTLPQSDARDTSLPVTVRTVVTMGLYREAGPFGRIGRGGREAVQHAIDLVGLSAFAGRLFGELSGGQQQRAILARALASHPRLLLLDEPFNGLDRENREMLLDLVARQRDEGRTVIVSTHDLEIAKAACTHVLLLASGHEPGEPGHPAAFGTLADALTLDAVQHAFHDSTVEIDEHTVTTTREVDAQ
ncbi:metal ABC transporter ATP-binding protein [Leucobacter komagatae]|uniref:ABC transporter n=1 Tax=Leucobacter komagatae TaxID=55969 RepID=A0A0D0IK94_9MICO|nr:ABC transporter ATP-binding protein [Leucobacter komagatae]KIP51492.1 ABC transporter [Leucobacter komagatae]